MSDVKPIHDQNARFAIEGAIEYGRNGVYAPPDDHWLAPFWHMGKQLSELAALRAEVLEQAHLLSMSSEREAKLMAKVKQLADFKAGRYTASIIQRNLEL
jgi:hypothetical protein